MLTADEFTVGSFIDAKPPSLILPRNAHERPALVGTLDGATAAIVLCGDHRNRVVTGDVLHRLGGLIVFDIRIEVDEESLYDPDDDGPEPGSMVRAGQVLSLRSIPEGEPRQGRFLILHDQLPGSDGRRAAFRRWQVTIGSKFEKRVLWRSSNP